MTCWKIFVFLFKKVFIFNEVKTINISLVGSKSAKTLCGIVFFFFFAKLFYDICSTHCYLQYYVKFGDTHCTRHVLCWYFRVRKKVEHVFV